ncbi:hypothetical protein V8E54_000554 [Elaphomyces granulatus]
MPPVKFFEEVPASEAEWMAAATAANVINKSLKSCQDLRSGSSVTQEQFLLFRAICKKIRAPRYFNAASSRRFQSYLAAIGTDPVQSIGMFHIPILQQREVLISPQQNATPLNEIDETSVKSSFFSFLQAITAIDPAPDHKWTSVSPCCQSVRLMVEFSFTIEKDDSSMWTIIFAELQLHWLVRSEKVA